MITSGKKLACLLLLYCFLSISELKAASIETTPNPKGNDTVAPSPGGKEVTTVADTNGVTTSAKNGTNKSSPSPDAGSDNHSSSSGGSSSDSKSKPVKYESITMGESTNESNSSTVYYEKKSSEKTHTKWTHLANPQGILPSAAIRADPEGESIGKIAKPAHAPMSFAFGGFPNMVG